MTEQAQKIWDEAWEQGRKRGVEQGKYEMRYAEFIRPLLRYILLGLMVALGVIFGIGAIAFLCVANLVIRLIGLFISGSLCGVAWSVFVYFVKKYQ